jgi:mRNA deadenylase 3'-5' endonuclease subunit Ccr4
MFPVRYELNFYMSFSRNPAFKGLLDYIFFVTAFSKIDRRGIVYSI